MIYEHHTHPALLAEPVTLALIGAGGNGSQMLTGLARLHTSIRALGHPGLEVIVYDPDDVSEANLGRQLFAPADVGRSKAAVLVTRVNAWYGTRWAAVPARFQAAADGDLNIIVSCVDSAAARVAIGKTIKQQNGGGTYYWLDLGNRAADGQAILGIPAQDEQHEAYAFRLPTVLELFPELATDAARLDARRCAELLARAGARAPGALRQPGRRHAGAAAPLADLPLRAHDLVRRLREPQKRPHEPAPGRPRRLGALRPPRRPHAPDPLDRRHEGPKDRARAPPPHERGAPRRARGPREGRGRGGRNDRGDDMKNGEPRSAAWIARWLPGYIRENRSRSAADMQDLLSLVLHEALPPIATIEAWTPEQRLLADDWAINVHHNASDNANRVPAKPAFLESYR
jgi:PRTRC genetic system ThiF family protein